MKTLLIILANLLITLVAAQKEVSSHLLEKLRGFEGKETELRDDIILTRPSPILRSFVGCVLAYLQRFSAEISIRGQTKPAPNHVCEIREQGVRFNLSDSFKRAYYIEASWSELLLFYNINIQFSESLLPSIEQRGWFSI